MSRPPCLPAHPQCQGRYLALAGCGLRGFSWVPSMLQMTQLSWTIKEVWRAACGWLG